VVNYGRRADAVIVLKVEFVRLSERVSIVCECHDRRVPVYLRAETWIINRQLMYRVQSVLYSFLLFFTTQRRGCKPLRASMALMRSTVTPQPIPTQT